LPAKLHVSVKTASSRLESIQVQNAKNRIKLNRDRWSDDDSSIKLYGYTISA